MKKIILVLVGALFIFIGCEKQDTNTWDKFSIDNIKSINITALPSPPQTKTVQNKEEIVKIINFINDIEKKKISKENIKGWEFKVDINAEDTISITFTGDKLNIDGSWYKISDKAITQFRELYNSF